MFTEEKNLVDTKKYWKSFENGCNQFCGNVFTVLTNFLIMRFVFYHNLQACFESSSL